MPIKRLNETHLNFSQPCRHPAHHSIASTRQMAQHASWWELTLCSPSNTVTSWTKTKRRTSTCLTSHNFQVSLAASRAQLMASWYPISLSRWLWWVRRVINDHVVQRVHTLHVLWEDTRWARFPINFSPDNCHQPSLGGERWYMNQIQLSYSSNNQLFEHIDRPNLNVKLSTPPHTYLFPTPIGKSFECMNEKTVVMFSQVIAAAGTVNDCCCAMFNDSFFCRMRTTVQGT
jgi:hypothetical protein